MDTIYSSQIIAPSKLDKKLIHRPEVPLWREDAFMGQFCDGLINHETYSKAVARDQKLPDLKPTLRVYVSAIQHALDVRAENLRLLKTQDFEKLRTVASYIGPIARFEEYSSKDHFMFWLDVVNQTFVSYGYSSATFIIPVKYARSVVASKGQKTAVNHVAFLIVEGQGWSQTVDVTLVNSSQCEYHPSQIVGGKVKFRSCLHFKKVPTTKIKDPTFWFMIYHLRFETIQSYPDRTPEITLYEVIMPWLTDKPMPQAWEAEPANNHGPFETQMRSQLSCIHPVRSILRFMLMRGTNALDEKKVKQFFFTVRLSLIDMATKQLEQDMSHVPGGFQDSDRRIIQEATKKVIACAGKQVQKGHLSHPDLRQLRVDMENLAKRAVALASPFTALNTAMKFDASAPIQSWPGFEYIVQEPQEDQKLSLLGEKTQAPPQDVFINMQVQRPRTLQELTQQLQSCVQRCKRLKGSQANSGSRPGKVPAQQIAAHIEQCVLEEWPCPSLSDADAKTDMWCKADGNISSSDQRELCAQIRDCMMEYQDAIYVTNNSSIQARGETLITASAFLAMCDATVRISASDSVSEVTEIISKGFVLDTSGIGDKSMGDLTAGIYFFQPNALITRAQVLTYFEEVQEKVAKKNKPKVLFYCKGQKRFERYVFLNKETIFFLQQLVDKLNVPLSDENGSTTKSLVKWACRDEEGQEPGGSSWGASDKNMASPLWALMRDIHAFWRNLFGDYYYSTPGGKMQMTWRDGGDDTNTKISRLTYNLPGAPAMRNTDYSADNKGQDKTFIKKEKVTEATVLFDENKYSKIMSTEEFEKYKTYLTAPGLKLPLLLEFFAAGRDAYLMNAELANTLLEALFQPGDFSSEELMPTEIPVPDSRRAKELGTKYGLMMHEILFAPVAIADPLVQMLRAIIDRSVGEYRKQLGDLTMWMVRIVVTVLDYFRVASLLEAECPPPTELLNQMRMLLQRRVKPLLLGWLKELDPSKQGYTIDEIYATLALIAQAVPILELKKNPAMIEEVMVRTCKVLAQHALSSATVNNPVGRVVSGYEGLRSVIVEWAQNLEVSDKKLLDEGLSRLVHSVADADDVGETDEWVPFAEPTKCRGWLFQSGHPYTRAQDVYEEVVFPGVTSIEIIFHYKTHLTAGDYITIYKDRSMTESWRLGMSATTWPGPSEPPLTIPADRFVFHFHSAATGQDPQWGFMVLATAPVSPERIKLLTIESGQKMSEVKAALSYFRNDMEKAKQWLLADPETQAKTNVRFAKSGGMMSNRDDLGPSGFYSNKSASVRINLQTSEVYRNNQRQIPVPYNTASNYAYKECMPQAMFCVPTEYTSNREVIRVVDKNTIYEVQTWKPLQFDEVATEEVLIAEQAEIDEALRKEGKDNENADFGQKVEAVNMGGTTELGLLNFPSKCGYNKILFRGIVYTRYEEGSLGWVSQKMDAVFEEFYSSYGQAWEEVKKVVKLYSRAGNAEVIERLSAAVNEGSAVPVVAAHLLMYTGDPGRFNNRISGHWKEIIARADLRTIEVYSFQESGRRAFRELEFSSELNESLASLEAANFRRDPRVLTYARNAAGALSKQIFSEALGRNSVVIRRARNVHTVFQPSDHNLEEDAIETFVSSVALRGTLPEALWECYNFWQTGPRVLRGYLKKVPEYAAGETVETANTRQKLKRVNHSHIIVQIRLYLYFWRPKALAEKLGAILALNVQQTETFEVVQERARLALLEEAKTNGIVMEKEELTKCLETDYAGQTLTKDEQVYNLASWNGTVIRLWSDEDRAKVLKQEVLLNPFSFGGLAGNGLKVLSQVFRTAESVGQVLVWSLSKPLEEGDECSIDRVELPRLQLTFRRSVGSHGEVRLSSEDFDGKFINLLPSAATRSLARMMPHSIFLVDSTGENYLMVPNYDLRRVQVETCPLSTDLTFSKSSAWSNAVKSPTYVYTVHRSAAFLLAPSLAASLYLVTLALYAGEYEQCSRLITDCQNDTKFSTEEAYISKMAANTFAVDRHPDACACRVRLALVMFESGETPSWDWEADTDSYIRYIDRVSWECRLTQLELDQVQSKVQKNVKEAKKKLEEKRKQEAEERLKSGKEETEEEKKKREEAESIHEISFELVAEAKDPKQGGQEWFDFLKGLPTEMEKYMDRDEWKNGMFAFRTPPCVKDDFKTVGQDTVDMLDNLSRDYPTGQGQKLGFVFLHMMLLGQFSIRWHCYTAEEEQQLVKDEREKLDKFITEYNRLVAAGEDAEAAMDDTKEDMIDCSFCGTKNTYSSEMCPQCGRRLVFVLNEGQERKRNTTQNFRSSINLVGLFTRKLFQAWGKGRDPTSMAQMRLPLGLLAVMTEAKNGKTTDLEPFPSFPYAKNKRQLSSYFYFMKGQIAEFLAKSVEEAVKYTKGKVFQKFITDTVDKIPKPKTGGASSNKVTLKPPSRPLLEDTSCGEFLLTSLDWGARESDKCLNVTATTLDALTHQPLQEMGGGTELDRHIMQKPMKQAQKLPFDPQDPPSSLSGPQAKAEWAEMLGRIQQTTDNVKPGSKLRYFPSGEKPTDEGSVVKVALDQEALPRLIQQLLTFQNQEECWIEGATERLELMANVREVKEGQAGPVKKEGFETGAPPLLRLPNLASAILAEQKQRISHLKLLNNTIEEPQWEKILVATVIVMLRVVRLAQINRCLNLSTQLRRLLQEFALRKLYDLMDSHPGLEAKTTHYMLRSVMKQVEYDPDAALKKVQEISAALDRLKVTATNHGLEHPEEVATLIFQYFKFDEKTTHNKLTESTNKTRFRKNLDLAKRGCHLRGKPLYNASEKSSRPAQTTAAMWHVLQSTASALGEFLATGSHYFHEAKQANVEGNAYTCDPRFLVFEFMVGYTLRQRQVELVLAFVDAHRVQNRSSVRQMIMGAGKTTVIAPLLGLILADGESLITQVVPPALLDMSRSVLRNAFTSILSKSVLTLNFTRDSTESGDIQEQFQKLYEKLTRARRQRSILLATPATIKALMLKYIDLLNNEHSASPALFVPFKQSIGISKSDAIGMGNMVAKSGLAADELARVLKLFGSAEKGIALVDEVDMILHPLKSELNFPIGQQEALPMAVHRMRLAIHLLEALFYGQQKRVSLPYFKAIYANILESVSKQMKIGEEKLFIRKEPHTVLLQEFFYEESLRPLVAEWSWVWLCQQKEYEDQVLYLTGQTDIARDPEERKHIYQAQTSLENLKNIVVKYISNTVTVGEKLLLDRYFRIARSRATPPANNDGFAKELKNDIESEKLAMQFINLCKEWVVSFFPHCISKVVRVAYGLLQDSHAYQWYLESLGPSEVPKFQLIGLDPGQRDDLWKDIPERRRLVAVPYVGKDVPSRTSEFAHPEVMTGLTILAYRYEGLRPNDVLYLVNQLKKSLQEEGGAYSERKSYILFEEWIQRGRAFRARQAGKDAASYEDDLHVLPLHIFNPLDTEQLQHLTEAIQFTPEVINYYLQNQALRKTLTYQRVKLSASGVDLGSDILFGRRLGFSGTPSNLLPHSLYPCEFEPGSEAQIINLLTNPRLVGYSLVESDWSVDSFLTSIAQSEPKFYSLIDTAALITGKTNLEVAQHLLEKGLKHVDACVFLDNADKKLVVDRTGKVVPLALSGISPSRYFVFFDQVHTTGMDITMPIDALAAVTVGKGMTLRDHAQGCYRMRGFGKGQTLHIFLMPEVKKLVAVERPGLADAKIATHQWCPWKPTQQRNPLEDVMAWLLANSYVSERVQRQALRDQQLSNAWRGKAFQDLLCSTAPGMNKERDQPLFSRFRDKPIDKSKLQAEDMAELDKRGQELARKLGVPWSKRNDADLVSQLTDLANMAQTHAMLRHQRGRRSSTNKAQIMMATGFSCRNCWFQNTEEKYACIMCGVKREVDKTVAQLESRQYAINVYLHIENSISRANILRDATPQPIIVNPELTVNNLRDLAQQQFGITTDVFQLENEHGEIIPPSTLPLQNVPITFRQATQSSQPPLFITAPDTDVNNFFLAEVHLPKRVILSDLKALGVEFAHELTSAVAALRNIALKRSAAGLNPSAPKAGEIKEIKEMKYEVMDEEGSIPSPSLSSRNSSISTVSATSAGSTESEEPTSDPNDPVYFPTSAVTPSTWLSQCLKVFREKISWDVPDIVPQDIPFRAQLFGKAAKRKAFVDTEKPKLMVYRVLMDVPPTVDPRQISEEEKMKAEKEDLEPPPPPRFDSEMVQEQEKEVEAEVASQQGPEDLEKFLPLRSETSWRFNSLVTSAPGTLIPITFYPIQTFHMMKDSKATLKYPSHILLSENHAPLLHQNTVKRRRLRNVLVILEWHVAPAYRDQGREYALWRTLKGVEREVYAPPSYDPDAKFSLTDPINTDGQFMVAVSLAEAESLRRAIQLMYRLAARGELSLGGKLMDLESLPKLRLYGADLGVKLTPLLSVDKTASRQTFYPASWRPSPCDIGMHALRFFNGNIKFSEEELVAVMTALRSLTKVEKEAHFKAVMEGRRREASDISQTGIGKIFDSDNPDVLLTIRENVAKVQQALDKDPKGLRVIFKEFDADNSDWLDYEEMVQLIHTYVPDMHTVQVETMLRHCDEDGSSTLTWREFVSKFGMAGDNAGDIGERQQRKKKDKKKGNSQKVLTISEAEEALDSAKSGVVISEIETKVVKKKKEDLDLLGGFQVLEGGLRVLDEQHWASEDDPTGPQGTTFTLQGMELTKGRWVYEVVIDTLGQAPSVFGWCHVKRGLKVGPCLRAADSDQLSWGFQVSSRPSPPSDIFAPGTVLSLELVLGGDQEEDVESKDKRGAGKALARLWLNGKKQAEFTIENTSNQGKLKLKPLITLGKGLRCRLNLGTNAMRFPSLDEDSPKPVMQWCWDKLEKKEVSSAPKDAYGQFSNPGPPRNVSDDLKIARLDGALAKYKAEGILLTNGKWYWELAFLKGSLNVDVLYGFEDRVGVMWYYKINKINTYSSQSGQVAKNEQNIEFRVAREGDVFGCALDLYRGTIDYSINGVWNKVAMFSDISPLKTGLIPTLQISYALVQANLGGRPFRYSPPDSSFLRIQSWIDAHQTGPDSYIAVKRPALQRQKSEQKKQEDEQAEFVQVLSGRRHVMADKDLNILHLATKRYPSVTFPNALITKGKWYFEVKVVEQKNVTGNLNPYFYMIAARYSEPIRAAVGWGTSSFYGSSFEMLGAGDDERSFALRFEGGFLGKATIRTNGKDIITMDELSQDDMIGCAIDLDAGLVQFTVNGELAGALNLPPETRGEAFMPVISTTSKLKLQANLGQQKFWFPPHSQPALNAGNSGSYLSLYQMLHPEEAKLENSKPMKLLSLLQEVNKVAEGLNPKDELTPLLLELVQSNQRLIDHAVSLQKAMRKS
eukprot:gb/GEZN01000008.1/.p1 GENE.gb/GEZN01000008.1/~~gb/GEZN01000008.1/.p1  ORF type:complete len:5332 (+),score=895.35 gb/GEZN01000008.1/:82-16077(+)